MTTAISASVRSGDGGCVFCSVAAAASNAALRRVGLEAMVKCRNKKEETVEKVKQELDSCHLIAAISYKSLTVSQFQELRTQLPETTKLLVAKNTLVYKAIEGTKWATLKPCMKGMNAWLFVHSEEISAALKPYRTFQKEKKLEDNDFTGAVFEWKFYGPGEFKALENLPTRTEF
ncbi:hypothetical protein SASPL_143721 [Salvia splendens]|uniref:Large ribosomal subunit protein uL10c n=1 Tax=Salvia splendens TaxID=180675 RepID=A0A8X8WMC5_SALSN|nr:hypothetical protein SASPL_143721 [Salvia splendens]